VTGVFAACWGVIALSNPLVVGIENILGPKIAHASALSVSKLRKIVHKTTIFLSVATGLFSLLILIFGNELIVKIYGKQYAGNGVFLFVLSLSILALTTASPAAYGLWALERSDINCKINLLALCVTLTIGLWFVKFFGPLGAAFGLLLGNTSASAVRFMIFYRLIRPPSTHGIN
jgi:O-antigen/teichoic acid export membrane protein